MVSYIVTERRLNASDYARILQHKEMIYPKSADALAELICDFGNAEDNKYMYRIESTCEPHNFLNAYHIDGSIIFEYKEDKWDCYMACKRKWAKMLSDVKAAMLDKLESRRV